MDCKLALNEYLKTAGLPLVSVVISVQVSATWRGGIFCRKSGAENWWKNGKLGHLCFSRKENLQISPISTIFYSKCPLSINIHSILWKQYSLLDNRGKNNDPFLQSPNEFCPTGGHWADYDFSFHRKEINKDPALPTQTRSDKS